MDLISVHSSEVKVKSRFLELIVEVFRRDIDPFWS